MSKIYVYVDETGIDPRSNRFIVSSIIVASTDLASTKASLREVEHKSRKKSVKWARSTDERNVTYFRLLIDDSNLLLPLAFCSLDAELESELSQKCNAIAHMIGASGHSHTKAVVLIDGELSRGLTQGYANILRKSKILKDLNIRIDKVKGVRKSADDPISRYADACCGLVRAGLENKRVFQKLYADAQAEGLTVLDSLK